MSTIKLGSWTNKGRVLWMDKVSHLVPDPLVRVSSTNLLIYRLSELTQEPEPDVRIKFCLVCKFPKEIWYISKK